MLGLAEVGEVLVCKDPATGELFGLPADERLRAASRGDVSRLGQLEIEMESQLRPREIQARIRAGATLEEVAAAAGTDPVRIERFAYPVLLERSSIAEKAQRGHLMSNGVPGRRRLGDLVAAVLADRGHAEELTWDAFKEAGGWVLSATWQAGRTENRAHWRYHPGPDSGTLTAHDAAAAELFDPEPKPLHTVRSSATDDPPTQEIPKIPAEPTPAQDQRREPGGSTTTCGGRRPIGDHPGLGPAARGAHRHRLGAAVARPTRPEQQARNQGSDPRRPTRNPAGHAELGRCPARRIVPLTSAPRPGRQISCRRARANTGSSSPTEPSRNELMPSSSRSCSNFSASRSADPMNRCGESSTCCSVSSMPVRSASAAMTLATSPARSSVSTGGQPDG